MPREHHPAFDRLCLVENHLLSAEIEALVAADGLAHPAADLDWLRGRGLLARTVGPAAAMLFTSSGGNLRARSSRIKR